VNASNPVTSVSRGLLSDIFFKKTTRWANDTAIQPVDGTVGSEVRRRFSEQVLQRSVMAVKSYWQQVVFARRRVPPRELESDADIVTYVSNHPGAVGYVGGPPAAAGVKVVELR